MFRFFRKHRWLLIVVMGITAVTFVTFMGSGPSRSGGGGSVSNLGSIGDRKITLDQYLVAQHEVYIFDWLRFHQWPDRDPNISAADLRRDIYMRLMLIQRGQDLGIQIGDEVVATAANEILSQPGLVQALGVNGQSVPLDGFVKAVLQPKGLDAGDFENFVRHEMVMEQLRQAMGLTGQLITPQEAASVYRRQYQELSAQIVFFSASNYLASVPVTPEAVGQFYTNYLAAYRLPDRVQVSYVAFSVTNFMAGAEKKLSQTNLDAQVEADYRQYGTNAFPDAKTPEESRAKIRDFLIRQQALADARQQADEFANEVFNLDPVRPENLAAAAKPKGLTVHLTAPEAFMKAALALTPDEPLAGPIIGRDAVYVIALAKQLPSEIPPLGRIRDRVTADYQLHEATLYAQAAGTNFVQNLQQQGGLASARVFSVICTAAGLHSEALPPFSLSTSDLPELGDRVTMNQLKSAAFATSIGHASDFEKTDDGGFVVYVGSQLPLDITAMNANLPRFAAALREQRETAAFYNWIEHTGSRDLRNTPIAPGQSGDNSP